MELQDTRLPRQHQGMEENYTDWYHMEDEYSDQNTLSILKALGRQGISIRAYNG